MNLEKKSNDVLLKDGIEEIRRNHANTLKDIEEIVARLERLKVVGHPALTKEELKKEIEESEKVLEEARRLEAEQRSFLAER